MKNIYVRLVLVLLAIAAAGGAGYYAFSLEQRAGALLGAERAFTEDVLRLQATLADLRASQAGYLATGQDTALWIEKSAQLRQQAQAQLERISGASPAADVEGDIATVGEALASLGRFDKRIGELLREEQTLTASGLIFTDSAQVVRAATTTLSSLRAARGTRTGIALAEWRRLQLYALGGAAGLIVLVALVLLPVGHSQGERDAVQAGASSGFESQSSESAPHSSPFQHVGLGLDMDLALRRRSVPAGEIGPMAGGEELREEPGWSTPPRDPAEGLEGLDAQLRAEPEGGRFAAPPPAGPAIALQGTDGSPGVDLGAAAQLCTDLARVRDTSELQGLLGRAAALLDASGIVVWMGGAGGDVLWPAFSHGYTPQALSKMQALPRDGATPVSVAFRRGLMEVVPAADRTSGAIVAPILTSGGCAGVMAAEVRGGAEASEAEQALAGIIAAQLATLVAGESQ
jgi:hypothetical protein